MCGVECQAVASSIFEHVQRTTPGVPDGSIFQVFESTLGSLFATRKHPCIQRMHMMQHILLYTYSAALHSGDTLDASALVKD